MTLYHSTAGINTAVKRDSLYFIIHLRLGASCRKADPVSVCLCLCNRYSAGFLYTDFMIQQRTVDIEKNTCFRAASSS